MITDKPTSFDIAQRAGVSQPTVSRALRGDPTVSEATRKRIEAIAAQLNYKVDKNASSLRSRHTNTLALLFFEDPTPDESLINPFFLSMLGSIARTCALRGYDLLTSFQQLSSNWHVDYEDSHKADGIILLGYGDYTDYRPKLEQLVERGAHFVRWGAATEGQIGTTVSSDNEQGGFDATSHLLLHGRRKIAFIGTAEPGYPEFLERWRGYCRALRAAGIEPDDAFCINAAKAVHEYVAPEVTARWQAKKKAVKGAARSVTGAAKGKAQETADAVKERAGDAVKTAKATALTTAWTLQTRGAGPAASTRPKRQRCTVKGCRGGMVTISTRIHSSTGTTREIKIPCGVCHRST